MRGGKRDATCVAAHAGWLGWLARVCHQGRFPPISPCLQGGTHCPVPVMQHVCRSHLLGPVVWVRNVGSTAMRVLWQCCCTLLCGHMRSKNQGTPLEHGLAAAVEGGESSSAPAWHIRRKERRQQRKRSAHNDTKFDRKNTNTKTGFPLAARAQKKTKMQRPDPRSS